MNIQTRRMVESAILIAIGTVLSLRSFASPRLMGGSVTLGSLLTLVLLSHRWGTKWGIFAAVVYSLVQLVLGINNITYAPNATTAVAIILLDYIFAFGVLGLSAVFSGKVRSRLTGILLGIALTYSLRFVCHFLSGWLIWDALWPNEAGMAAPLYSLTYNASYMVPETLIALAVAAASFPALRKFWQRQEEFKA